ncbi:MAG: GNAT family N-acetyltransferase [Hydrogenophilaceae bacterium]|jgi:RimJ/RimL family protein N-acetyltransferase|nr:GNAT family N-acetyltransferase [Hydrogenophilaceae bacterium]
MSAPPKTVLHASAEEEAAIRAAVRAAADMASPTGERRLARLEDAAAAAAFFADEAVSGPIYDLPRPFTEENVRAWIAGRIAKHEAGEGILTFVYDGDEIVSYADVAVWPQHASGELAGAVRADRQNSGQGSANMRAMFEWMFEGLGLRLICLTAALDNIRSQRGIDAAGFTRMGGRDVVRPDGTVRQSVYWEMTREAWRAKWKSAS